jgi:hypothetical protein
MAVVREGAETSRWARIAIAATGVAATAVFFLGAFTPNLPMYGDSLSDWGRWAAIHHSEARIGVSLVALMYLLYMVFGAYVATLVRGNDLWTHWLVRVATVAIGVKFAVEMMQVLILILPTQIASRDFIPALAQLGSELSVFSLVPFFVFLFAVGAAALISRLMPVWLAWFTLAVGAIHAFAMVLGLTGAPPIGVALMAFGVVWFLSIPAWPLVTAVGLIVVAVRGFKPATRTSSTAVASQPT